MGLSPNRGTLSVWFPLQTSQTGVPPPPPKQKTIPLQIVLQNAEGLTSQYHWNGGFNPTREQKIKGDPQKETSYPTAV